VGLRKETVEPFGAMTEKRLRRATRVIVMEAKLSGEPFLMVPDMVVVP
jgi:hypothetical protein